nr:immunoglobulin light chain junction region [Macaca mulatta]
LTITLIWHNNAWLF